MKLTVLLILFCVACLAQAPLMSTTGTGVITQFKDDPPAFDPAAYAICRMRGHVAIAYGNMHSFGKFTNFVLVPDKPATSFKERDEGPWQRCFYCHKEFRTVVLVEER